MVGLLSTLQEMVGLSAEEEDSKKADRIDSIKEKIANLCNKLDETNEVSSRGIQELQDCSANPGANYYWILFVILYGGVYFLQ